MCTGMHATLIVSVIAGCYGSVFNSSPSACETGCGIVGWGGVFDARSKQIEIPSSLYEGVKSVTAGRYAFAAITIADKVEAWGDARWGGDVTVPDPSTPSKLQNGVKKIASSQRAFAALTPDGSVVTWGDPLSGGEGSGIASDVVDITANAFEFAALTLSGKVITWGTNPQPSIVAFNSTKAVNVQSIFATPYAFAALTQSGNAFSWGSAEHGGDDSSVVDKLHNVKTIVSSDAAFAAITGDEVVVWGSTTAGGSFRETQGVAVGVQGGNISWSPGQGNEVTKIVSGVRAFAALRANGKVVTWGDTAAGGDSSLVQDYLVNVVDIVSTKYAFAALTSQGSVVTWGNTERGGELGAARGRVDTGVAQVFSNLYAFAALRNDGSVVTWGNADRGGDSSVVGPKLLGGVVTIFSTEQAFAALKSGGEVVTWGSTQYGGQVPSEFSSTLTSRVKTIASDIYGQGFVALLCVPTTNNAGSCEQCPVNARWDKPELACKACQRNEVALLNGIEKNCSICPSGQVPKFDGSECVSCNPDEYAEAGSETCTRCASGEYVTVDKASCNACPRGEIPAPEGGSCLKCEAGYIPNSQQATCEACGASSYAAPGDATCSGCVLFATKNGAGDGCAVNLGLLFPVVSAMILVVIAAIFWLRRRARSKTVTQWILDLLDDWGKRKDLIELEKMLELARKAGGISRAVIQKVELQLDIQLSRYSTFDALQQILGEGDLRMVRGSLLEKQGDRMWRQQDLQNGKIFNSEACSSSDVHMQKIDGAFWKEQEFKQRIRMIAVVAVSYCWCHPNHPDPAGHHFEIVKHAAKLRMEVKGKGTVQDLAIFFDYMSIAQHGDDGDRSQPQRIVQRSDTENASFKRGLYVVNIPYANQLVETWVLAWVPKGVASKYEDRAWPTFEYVISSLVKDPNNLIILSDKSKLCTDFDSINMEKTMARKAPYTPDKFLEVINTKKVTNGSDLEILRKKYKETFTDVISHGKSLWFANLGWDDTEAYALANVFESCTALETIIVCGNLFTKEAALHLVTKSEACPTLKSMDLADNDIRQDETPEIMQAWVSMGRDEGGLNLLSHKNKYGKRYRTEADIDMLANDPSPLLLNNEIGVDCDNFCYDNNVEGYDPSVEADVWQDCSDVGPPECARAPEIPFIERASSAFSRDSEHTAVSEISAEIADEEQADKGMEVETSFHLSAPHAEQLGRASHGRTSQIGLLNDY